MTSIASWWRRTGRIPRYGNWRVDSDVYDAAFAIGFAAAAAGPPGEANSATRRADPGLPPGDRGCFRPVFNVCIAEPIRGTHGSLARMRESDRPATALR